MRAARVGTPFRLGALGLGALVLAFAAVAQSDDERALEAVRAEIGSLERRLADQIDRRDDNARALKTLELEIGAAERRLGELARAVSTEEARLADLSEQTRRAGERLGAERTALARQVRTSYLSGRQELVKMLLSQESPASLGRMMVYYDYFNRARSQRIDTIAGELRGLRDLAGRARESRAELGRLERDQAREVARLDGARADRRALIASLDASIAASGTEIERLRGEEQRLNDLVEELGELLARLPRDTEAPFADLKGQLAWPVQGRLASGFGDLREGGPLRWRGVMLEASRGSPVRAVYHGRIAFADWLPGLGLLIIVDHGDGFMSLYGHNEALLREPGDWVGPGETIAEVGDSGGRSAASLYFEIRRNGEPVDPRGWIAADSR
jgi:septal ring factor EnvC (AmiA/AmiB activator)